MDSLLLSSQYSCCRPALPIGAVAFVAMLILGGCGDSDSTSAVMEPPVAIVDDAPDTGAMPASMDTDADGIVNALDFCPTIAATSTQSCNSVAPVVAPGTCADFGGELQPPFDSAFDCVDFGNLPEVPTRWGGLVVDPQDPNMLILGGSANTADGRLYKVALARDAACNIVGYQSTTVVDYAEAANNDGGVAFGPGGVLFLSRWPLNEIGQILPGANATSRIIDLDDLAVVSSPGGLNFVPDGFSSAGDLKIVSWSGGQFYTLGLNDTADGTFDIPSAVQETQLQGGPEGFAYVSGDNVGFNTDSMVVSEFSANTVSVYEVDADANPILETRREMLTGLNGAEGAAIDPLTGDYLFSTFGGGDRVVAVRGFRRPGCP